MSALSSSLIYFLIANCSTGDYLYLFCYIGSVLGTSLIYILSPYPQLGGISLYFMNRDFNSPLCCLSQVKKCTTHPSGIPGSMYNKPFKYSKGISAVVPNGFESPVIMLPISSAMTCFGTILHTYLAISPSVTQSLTPTYKVCLKPIIALKISKSLTITLTLNRI